ncbi:MAG: hypothetical protein WA604_14070, partial [Candidatus Sulfotelmatobacter sp.]
MLNMLTERICKNLYEALPKAVRNPGVRRLALCLTTLGAMVVLFAALAALAQDQTPQTQPAGQTPAQAQPPDSNNGKPKQDVPVEAGGPGDNVGPYAIPKKTDTEPPPPPPPPTPKKLEDVPDYSLTVNVPLVNVDVSVTTKDGQFVPGLKKEHFRIIEDGVPQTITNFSVSPAPITAVLLLEFASTNYPILRDTLMAAYSFANTMRKDDWLAVTYYDMTPHILVDFTQDKRAAFGALNQLRVPG